MNASDLPRPISMDYAPANCGERTSAGTKHSCIYCGRKTYRYVMSKPVCSYCTSRAGKLAREWNDRLPHGDG